MAGALWYKEDGLLEKIFMVINILFGANCFASVFLLPMAMLPNVLDEYFLTYNNKLDALFYTFFMLGSKIVLALFAGITQLVLR